MNENKDYGPTDWAQRRYHNERVYWHIEFFIKITLAICGGLIYIAINKNLILDDYNKLIVLGCILEFLVGIYCSRFIYLHSLTKWKKQLNEDDAKKRVIKSHDFKQSVFILFFSFLIPCGLLYIFICG